ncbi:MAG: NUDIX hydrolase [Bacteroidota bacterium]|nr:MAG: NUDIX hydrolase [Bacteroidota bacterium]
MEADWLSIAKRIQAIAQGGLEFGYDKYDLDRYQQLREISVEIMHGLSDEPVEKITNLFACEKGYQTPKVDVRGVVFRENKLLMVKEGVDGNWALPGGWADIAHTPFEVAKKEVWEEAGLKVDPVRLLAVLDKTRWPMPPDKYHIYKMFILCKDLGGELTHGMETLDAKWMDRSERLPLSLPRTCQEQIELMFEFFDSPQKEVVCD